MAKRLLLLCTIVSALTISVATWATTLKLDELQTVTEAVISLCRGGTLEGESKLFSITGGGDGTVVVLKKLVEIGVDGNIAFTKEEWQGIKAVVPDQWNQSSYNDCVIPNVDKFLEKLSAS